MHDRCGGDHHQQHRGQRPSADRERGLPGNVDRQQQRRGREDAGAHHRGEPVRTDVGERVAAMLEL
jgi:hypothetical protein